MSPIWVLRLIIAGLVVEVVYVLLLGGLPQWPVLRRAFLVQDLMAVMLGVVVWRGTPREPRP